MASGSAAFVGRDPEDVQSAREWDRRILSGVMNEHACTSQVIVPPSSEQPGSTLPNIAAPLPQLTGPSTVEPSFQSLESISTFAPLSSLLESNSAPGDERAGFFERGFFSPVVTPSAVSTHTGSEGCPTPPHSPWAQRPGISPAPTTESEDDEEEHTGHTPPGTPPAETRSLASSPVNGLSPASSPIGERAAQTVAAAILRSTRRSPPQYSNQRRHPPSPLAARRWPEPLPASSLSLGPSSADEPKDGSTAEPPPSCSTYPGSSSQGAEPALLAMLAPPALQRPLASRTAEEVAAYIEGVCGFPQYAHLFASKGVCGVDIADPDLCEDDLRDIGVGVQLHRRRLLAQLLRWREDLASGLAR